MTTNPVYPKGVLPWADRVDEVDVVWAVDPNSLAADLVAVENTLGIEPQQMKNPMLGPQVNFVNVDQRMDYLAAGQNVPVALLYNSGGIQVANRQGSGTHYGAFNQYQHVYEPIGPGTPFFNGSDITIPSNGWYSIDANQSWAWSASGYVAMSLYFDDQLVDMDKWDWGFQGNAPGGAWQVPGNPHRPGSTKVRWSGILNQGTRVRVVSENGTATPRLLAYRMSLTLLMHRLTPWDYHLLPFSPQGVGTNPAVLTRYPAATGLSLANLGNGNVCATWNMITTAMLGGGPSAVASLPVTYSVAVYAKSPNGQDVQFYNYQTVPAPAVVGQMSWTIPGLATGQTYQVAVWPNGGIVSAPQTVQTITI